MNLFVAKLNPSTNTKDLQKLFAHYGLVDTVKVIVDHVTGKSKCYGFVEMPNIHEAHEALRELDNTLFQDSTITVKESQNTDMRFFGDGASARNRTNVTNSYGDFDNQPLTRKTSPIIKPRRESENPKNFGYRGSGFRDFR